MMITNCPRLVATTGTDTDIDYSVTTCLQICNNLLVFTCANETIRWQFIFRPSPEVPDPDKWTVFVLVDDQRHKVEVEILDDSSYRVCVNVKDFLAEELCCIFPQPFLVRSKFVYDNIRPRLRETRPMSNQDENRNCQHVHMRQVRKSNQRRGDLKPVSAFTIPISCRHLL